MSFASRMGIVLRRASGSSNSSLLQAVRCMSSSKLFVGGLSYATDDPTLRDAFSGYGDVLEARIIMDRESGRSKGFGFVTYASTEAAAAAISAMDGRDLHGRMIKVEYASDRAGGTRGGGYGTGNYGSGGYGGAGFGSGGGGYAGNGGCYGSGGHGSGGGYGNAGYGGYSSAAGGGEYSSINNNAVAGGYGGIDGSYNNASNSGGSAGNNGSAGGNNFPNMYGAGNYNSGAGGNAVLGEKTGSFSSGHSAVAGGNNGSAGGNNSPNTYGAGNFNSGAGSRNGSSYAGGFGGAETLGASKVQYNGQDDLLGADYFSESEDRHAGRSA
ncbi:hypothetical protein CFC21_028848 [Triticum aestivum]|uniref:RRM domain-containing protein n=2 Tax=Triticum aestivum TaxID=4565 RepID=A0A3B6DCY5_WHEAT|nr:hypothetical protein CFC21_028848 [Triticum aestivum]